MIPRRRILPGLVAPLCCVLLGMAASAAHASSSDDGCAELAQQAANGIAATLKADDQTVTAPLSVTTLTCLDGFFKGLGLNVLANGLDPAALLNSVVGKICSQVETAWSNKIGAAQCGLTVTGFNTNFDIGLGGGLFCPKLVIGGGGDTLLNGTAGGNSQWTGFYVNGHPQLPDGYSPVSPGGGS